MQTRTQPRMRSAYRLLDDYFHLPNPWDTLILLDSTLTLHDLDHGAELRDTKLFSKLFKGNSLRNLYAALNVYDKSFKVLGSTIRAHDASMEEVYGIQYVPFETPLLLRDREIEGAYSTDGTKEISSMLALPDTQGKIVSNHDWDLGLTLEDIANTVGDILGIRTEKGVPAFAYRIPYQGPGGIVVPYADNHGFAVRQ